MREKWGKMSFYLKSPSREIHFVFCGRNTHTLLENDTFFETRWGKGKGGYVTQRKKGMGLRETLVVLGTVPFTLG